MTKKKNQDLNMSRVWRDELKTLKRNRKKVLNDDRRAHREIRSKVMSLERASQRARKVATKTVAAIDRRVLILEGRLS